VSVYPCSVCRQRRPGKMATAYWAWFNADGNRSAWKQRFCASCAVDGLRALLSTLKNADSDSNVFACVSCGADASEDSDPVYLTLYVPGQEPQEFALQLDGPCAVNIRARAQSGAERLADRGGLVRGPSPSTSAWDALGLAPTQT
jgi:HSP20 family molecular chaperone IbpA